MADSANKKNRGRVTRSLLQHLASPLIKYIEPDFLILNELVCLNVLDSSDRVCIESVRENVVEQNKRLLNFLIKKSDDELGQFLLALDASDQAHVANWIEFHRDGKATKSSGTESDDAWPLSDDQMSIINKNRSKLQDLLDTDYDLRRAMRATKCLKRHQIDSLQTLLDNHQRNGTLLTMLLRRSVAQFNEFIECLEEHQRHLIPFFTGDEALWNESDGAHRPLDDDLLTHISSKSKIICGFIEWDSGLLAELYSKHCISQTQCSIMEESVKETRNELFLHILRCKSISEFKKFMSCLSCTNQRHVVRLIMGNAVVADIRAHLTKLTVKSSDSVETIEKKIVSRLRAMRTIYDEKSQHYSIKTTLMRCLSPLNILDLLLLSFRLSNSISSLFVCQSLEELRSLQVHFKSGRMQKVLEDVFTLLAEEPVEISLLEWTEDQYDSCVRHFVEYKSIGDKPVTGTDAADISEKLTSYTSEETGTNIDSQPSKNVISNLPLREMFEALPWEMVELIVVKTAISFYQSYRVCLLPRADVRTFMTLSSVCHDWRVVLTHRKFIRRQLRRTFQLKLTGDVPLELLKAAILLRKLVTSDVTASKPLKSDGDDVTTKELLKSERNVDQQVLSSLAAVCRHWSTTFKTRSAISRQQLCLMLHNEEMQRMARQLRKNRFEVISHLSVSDELVGGLVAAECISDRQGRHLRTLPLSCRSSKLLKIMVLKNIVEYQMFLVVLRRTSREDIAVLLESTHVVDGEGRVYGVTTINDEMFVLRGIEEMKKIDVYSTRTLELLRTFDMKNMFWLVNSLTSCKVNNCLYLADWRQDHETIHKVDATTGNKLMYWRVDRGPYGVSVNKICNVLVTCRNANTIYEYTSSGSLIRRIYLQSSEVKFPKHAVELSNGDYVVSHRRPVRGVSVVNREGRVLFTYTIPRRSYHSIAVTADDSIIVAVYRTNQILLLNSTLSSARDLTVSLNCKLNGPRCIYYDDSHGRLYVGEWSGRVIIFENI